MDIHPHGRRHQEWAIHVPSNKEFDSNLKIKRCDLIDLQQDALSLWCAISFKDHNVVS